MSEDRTDQLEQLAVRGEKLQSLLSFAPRAFVLEFAGTPKSGKSTSVEAIRHFFSRNKFRVHVLTERAAECPIPMKGHLFFNTWCATSMLAELLANVETETDIIIVDRGILDSLVWLTLQVRRGELTLEEQETFESFLLLERWSRLTDLAVVMTVSAEDALKREMGQRLSTKPGSIMNPEVLQSVRTSVDEAVEKYSKHFKAVSKIDTTGKDFAKSGVELASTILDALEGFLDPHILVVKRSVIEEFASDGSGKYGQQAAQAAIARVASNAQFIQRSIAENNSDWVQIVPCGLIVHKEEVFLFERKEKDPKYRLFGHTTLWQGCHTAQCAGVQIPELLKRALMERISGSLFLSGTLPTTPMGYCWDRDDAEGSKHFGIAYRISIENDATALDLKKKEFRKQRGHGLSGRFHSWKQIREAQAELNLESWSRDIVKKVGDFTQ